MEYNNNNNNLFISFESESSISNSVEVELIASKISPEQKVVNELYSALLPIIVEDWEEYPSPVKKVFITAASDVTLCDPDVVPQVYIRFKNGNFYRGDLKEKRLHGKGIFQWSDGSIYEGTFCENCLEGEGKISYAPGARYVGQVSYGYHHGIGLLITDSYKYGGEFRSGVSHGSGRIDTAAEVFQGSFSNDKIDIGYREYNDCLFTGGFTEFAERDRGACLLSNGDIYKGAWNQDQYCDFGIYQWNPCKKLPICRNSPIPFGNYFAGYWVDSYRFGMGVEYFDDRIIYAIWKFDQKNGAGIIIAENGETFVAKDMFIKDTFHDGYKIIESKESDESIQKLRRLIKNMVKESEVILSESTLMEHVEELLAFAAKGSQIMSPMFLLKHAIDIRSTPIIDFMADFFPDVNRPTLDAIEVKWIQQALTSNYSRLENIYKKYAIRYGDKNVSGTKPILNRLGLWEFFKNICGKNMNLNISDLIEEAEYTFHLLSVDIKDPYETIYFWQFLKYVLFLTMAINRDRSIAQQALKERPKYAGLFGTMLLILLREYEVFVSIAESDFKKLFDINSQLIENIFGEIVKYFPLYSVRGAYRMFKDLEEKLNRTEKGNYQISFDDFVHSLSVHHSNVVRDNMLVHIDDNLTPLELCEIFIMLISKGIRNGKYLHQKQKFIDKFKRKLEELKALQAIQRPPSTNEIKETHKKKKKK